ncbi:putative phage abortive infection protein [Buttiauxella gaviniae]|uniref:putative phage abortive infection protein n=1 Tax=Buttiauxella gaviniae TaxID=82990 RepID=UPI0039B0B25A
MNILKKIDGLIRNLLEDETGIVLIKYAKIIFYTICLLLLISIIGLHGQWGQKLGTFGDFIGGVANPLLTFLTFICLIKTIFMQRDELALTRTEYSETKKVLRTQSVENTFYNGVNLHHELVNNLKMNFTRLNLNNELFSEKQALHVGTTEFNGRDCFGALIKYLTEDEPSQALLIERYKVINREKNEWFGHYFRNLYRILKIIDSHPDEFVSPVDKAQYCHTLRAQLSSNELALLMLNSVEGVCDTGQFRDLLSRYQMLEHLPLSPCGKNDDNVIVVGSFTVSYSFLGEFYRTDEEIKNNRKKLNLVRVPNGAFGKKIDMYFPKRYWERGERYEKD